MFRMFIKIYLWTNVTFDFKEKWLISDRSGCGTSFCWFRNKASNADHNPVNISNISHLLPPLFTFQGWHSHRSCFNHMLCQIQISTSHYHQYHKRRREIIAIYCMDIQLFVWTLKMNTDLESYISITIGEAKLDVVLGLVLFSNLHSACYFELMLLYRH